MILTPEEQLEYREEIDYAIETHGYEYVWGKETAMDKTKGLLRDAPGKIMDGINKIVTNPTVIAINEKLAAHNAKLNAEDNGKSKGNHTGNHMGNPMLGGIGSGSGFGGLGDMQAPPYQETRNPIKKKKKQIQPKPHYRPQPHDDLPADTFFGNSPLGEHPFNKKGNGKSQNGLHFGGDHL